MLAYVATSASIADVATATITTATTNNTANAYNAIAEQSLRCDPERAGVPQKHARQHRV